MAKTKYGNYIKPLKFKEYGPGSFRQGMVITPEYLGLDVYTEFGCFWTAGFLGKQNESEIHDFNEVNIFMGADMGDLSELNAEVELDLGKGKEMERHMISSSAAIFIPSGTQHMPYHITRMNKRVLYLSISATPSYKAKKVQIKELPAGLAGWQSKYRPNVSHLCFTRKSAWHYGPENPDDSGGSIGDIIAKDFGFNMSYESITRAPYRFGPKPDKPHSHPNYDEYALFLGADTNDLSVLGAEVETGMGPELERHVFNVPSLIKLPKKFPHGPLWVTKLDQPFIFAIIRPFGTGDEKH